MRRFFATVLDETAPVSVLEVGSELPKVLLKVFFLRKVLFKVLRKVP